MNDDVSLTVNNINYLGWKGVEITVSLESAASSFSLDVSDGDGTASTTIPILEGDACTIKIGENKIIGGFVDDIAPSFGATEHTISISGRSKTADIVDCSIDTAFEWKNKSFLSIAQSLCSPLGVNVTAHKDAGADATIPVFKIQPGETPFDALDRAARGINVLLVPDTAGDLFITKTGLETMNVSLEEGVNIKAGSATFSVKDRYKTYKVLGQGKDSDTFSLTGSAEDPYIKRQRILTILAEEAATQGYVTRRAQWESKVRAARAGTIQLTVQGWRTPDGTIWWPNKIVPVRSKTLRVDGELLITTVVLRKDSSGTTADLTLRRKDAFTNEPNPADEPEKKPAESTSRVDRNGWTANVSR